MSPIRKWSDGRRINALGDGVGQQVRNVCPNGMHHRIAGELSLQRITAAGNATAIF